MIKENSIIVSQTSYFRKECFDASTPVSLNPLVWVLVMSYLHYPVHAKLFVNSLGSKINRFDNKIHREQTLTNRKQFILFVMFYLVS